MIRRKTFKLLSGMSLYLLALPALSANPDFQAFYSNQACANASGEMSNRCATEGSNLSGDSESSLTPSHMLSAGDAALLGEKDENTQASSQLTQIGPLSISAQAGIGELESDNREGANGERAYSTDTERLAITFDYRHSDTLISGAILSLQRSDLEFEALKPQGSFPTLSRAGRYQSEALGLTGFITYSANNGLFIDGALGYSDIDHDFERNSVFQPGSRTAGSDIRVSTAADVSGDLQLLEIRGGRHYNHGRVNLTPQVSYQYSHTETDSYTETDETGSGLAMRYASYTQTSSRLSVGGDAHIPFNTDWGVLNLQVSLNYHREFGRENEKIKASFANDQAGAVFVIEGEEPDQSFFQAGLSTVLQFSHGWSAYFSYTQWLGNSEYNQYQSAIGVRREI